MRTGDGEKLGWLQVLIRELPGGRWGLAIAVTALVATVGITLWYLALAARLSPAPAAVPADPLAPIKAQIQPGRVSPAEERELRELLWEAYPIRPAQATDTVSFYFDLKPTQCGTVGGARLAHRRRFISRNGSVLLEGDLSTRSFEEFWLICRAAGLP